MKVLIDFLVFLCVFLCSLWFLSILSGAGFRDGHALRFLDNPHARARAYSRGAGADHLLDVLQAADAA